MLCLVRHCVYFTPVFLILQCAFAYNWRGTVEILSFTSFRLRLRIPALEPGNWRWTSTLRRSPVGRGSARAAGRRVAVPYWRRHAPRLARSLALPSLVAATAEELRFAQRLEGRCLQRLRPTGRRGAQPPVDNKPAKELQAGSCKQLPSRPNCFNQTMMSQFGRLWDAFCE